MLNDEVVSAAPPVFWELRSSLSCGDLSDQMRAVHSCLSEGGFSRFT
jgi:hypothetical protein